MGALEEGELQKALAASDAGVNALANVLDVDADFKTTIGREHAGSGNAAYAMTRTLLEDKNAGLRAELQLRADRGFVDAAGFAKNAARSPQPKVEEAEKKVAEAKQTKDPGTAEKLAEEAADALEQARKTIDRCMAPLMKQAEGDAAFGLGMRYAIHCALAATCHHDAKGFDAAFAKANANVLSVTASTIHLQG
jgi:hypothetical protein